MGGVIRLSRPCYDKPHKCPGRRGGGMKYAKRVRCTSGFILHHGNYMLSYLDQWRFGRCDRCNVITLPLVVRFLDPSFVFYAIRRWWVYR